MSRPVAGKNKKGEGRPRAAVKKTNEKTILPYDDIPMPGAVAGGGGDFLSGEPQYRRTGQRRPAERRYGRALAHRAARGFFQGVCGAYCRRQSSLTVKRKWLREDIFRWLCTKLKTI